MSTQLFASPPFPSTGSSPFGCITTEHQERHGGCRRLSAAGGLTRRRVRRRTTPHRRSARSGGRAIVPRPASAAGAGNGKACSGIRSRAEGREVPRGSPFVGGLASRAWVPDDPGRLFHRRDYGWQRVTGAESPRRLLHARQPEAGLPIASKNSSSIGRGRAFVKPPTPLKLASVEGQLVS